MSEINDGKAIRIMLDGDYVIKDSIGDSLTGIVTTTYKFSGEYIRDTIQSNKKVNDIFQANAKAAYAAGKEPVLYLESIFASYNANPDGSKTIRKDNLYTKQAIRDAEPWSNKEEWDKDHYNIPIKYGMSSPVYLQLCDSSGDMLEDITVDGVKPSGMTSTGYIRLGDYKVGMEKTFNISKYISVKSGDKPYSMYRTYYAVKKFPDDRRNDRKYTEGGEFSQADIAKVKVDDIAITSMLIVARYVPGGIKVKLRYTDEKGNDLPEPSVDGLFVDNPSLYGDYPEGKDVAVKIPKEVRSGGKLYSVVRSYYRFSGETKLYGDISCAEGSGHTQAEVMKQKFKAGDKDVVVVARYRLEDSPPDGGTEGGSTEGGYLEGTVTGVIAAGNRAYQPFDVGLGIPGTESLYTDLTAPQYLLSYKFKKVTGEVPVTVTVKKTYTVVTIPPPVDGKPGKPVITEVPVTQTVTVRRPYAYWGIGSFEVYGLQQGEVTNGSLPAGKVSLSPSGCPAPQTAYNKSTSESYHVTKPTASAVVELPGGTAPGGMVPSEDFTGTVEGMVGQCTVRNDSLVFKGQTVLSSAQATKEGPAPSTGALGRPPQTTPGTLYTDNQVIPGTRANGVYGSSGSATYNRVTNIDGTHGGSITLPGTVNSVAVHTPVVCPAQVEDMKRYCQLVSPDTSRAPLVLDTSFRVTLPTTGTHRGIKGYGTRDYAKYTASRQVKFPFDVYKGSEYVASGSWTELGVDTGFYLPAWVKEGKYSVEFRAVPINAYANNGLALTEQGANLAVGNYTAVHSIPVEISGRVYGLQVYDITDDLWKNIFWDRNHTEVHTGTTYRTGVRSQDGRETGLDPKYTAPLFPGSHPVFRNIGVTKTGYMFRYSMTTVGGYDAENDFIQVSPTFYYVRPDGTGRQEVDLYYNETFQTDGKKHILVRAGSSRDRQNVKSVRTFRAKIPDADLRRTAELKGIPYKEWISQNDRAYTVGDIYLPGSLMAFTGTREGHPVDLSTAPKTGAEIAVTEQRWYGEYYLPSEVYVCPEGFDLEGYVKKEGSLDYSEDFWLKNGYIIVNFDITTVRDGKDDLSYINAANAARGYCNMWKLQGAPVQKTDSYGNSFVLQDGDFYTYYTDKSVNNDYSSGGVY